MEDESGLQGPVDPCYSHAFVEALGKNKDMLSFSVSMLVSAGQLYFTSSLCSSSGRIKLRRSGFVHAERVDLSELICDQQDVPNQ